MDLPVNRQAPTIMYIDFNSCFATAEQQANPLLRGKPVVVAAYDSPGGCIISPSIEAKQIGIKVGMRVRDARNVYPPIIVRMPDPPKYRDIHLKFARLFRSYSPKVTPKSIDEAVIDFSHTPALKRGLANVGREIKLRIKREIGDWLSCNIGISTNRFLAKLAASLRKPDGLDVITHQNLADVYSRVSLTDLNGINLRFQARLNAYNIITPLDFFRADVWTLKKQVFKSICGYYWYLRLRGWEIDSVDFGRKSFGQSYALKEPTGNITKIKPMLMKLAEKMGRRLRGAKMAARTVHISCLYQDRSHWHKSKTFVFPLYSTPEFYQKMLTVFKLSPRRKIITHFFISCSHLIPANQEQLELFCSPNARYHKLADVLDTINNRFGEYIVIPATMMGMQKYIIDRVAFGGVKELEDLYG